MVRPATDTAKLPWRDEAEMVVSDLRTDDLDGLFADMELLIHLAATTRGSDDDKLLETMLSTERLLDAMRGSDTGRILLISSLAVYDWTAPQEVLSERSPLEPNVWTRDGYTRAKFFQERLTRELCAEEDWQLTVLRPGLVWGNGANYPLGPSRRIGSSYLVVGRKTVLPLTHIVNCAHYMAAAAVGDGAVGTTINLIDDYELTSVGLVREYLARSGESARCLAVPYAFASATVKAISYVGKRAFGDPAQLPKTFVPEVFAARYRPLRYDHTERRRRLGATSAPLGLDECLEVTFGKRIGP
jgi:nucleoside-diphosphate-sugar epimerase